jgi:hypothetical protein
MINEVRSLLSNSPDASLFFTMPQDFVKKKVDKVPSLIFSAIFGKTPTTEYRAFISDLIARMIYNDSEMKDLRESMFDKRIDMPPVFEEIRRATVYEHSGDNKIEVNTSNLDFQNKTRLAEYSFMRRGTNQVSVVGGISTKTKEITLTSQEVSTSSSWKKLEDTGILVKFFFNGSISLNYTDKIKIKSPFSFSLANVVDKLNTISGLDNLVYSVSREYPELYNHFTSIDRLDRKFMSIAMSAIYTIK